MHHSHKTKSPLPPQFIVTHPIHPAFGAGLECSRRFLVTGGVKEAEGWRPSEREGYRGQNLAAPLLQDVKVGQSVPWMISNSTFRGPIHWKYIYTHALSYIGREWVRGREREREIDKKWKYEYVLNWLAIRSLKCAGAGYSFETGPKEEPLQHIGNSVTPAITVNSTHIDNVCSNNKIFKQKIIYIVIYNLKCRNRDDTLKISPTDAALFFVVYNLQHTKLEFDLLAKKCIMFCLYGTPRT